MRNKVFLVPLDCTTVADVALNHALRAAESVGADIYLLHVVNKDKLIKEANLKLDAIIEQTVTTDKVKLHKYVRIGNIFEDIGDFAKEHSAELIFMGTHGAHGWQHVAGSHALKVITNSDVPFVVVQEKEPNENGYDDIVVPLDLHQETKQKLALVANMAKYFDSRVHIVVPDESDEFLKNKLLANITFANKFFSERSIDVKATVAPKSGFDKEIVKLAISIDADLIAIMNIQKNNILGTLSSSYEQYMITNDAKIPVMCVNPVTTDTTGSVMFM
jgi:nucleotide-binding universal stress UspA family protein